jgi:uncharacterized protein
MRNTTLYSLAAVAFVGAFGAARFVLPPGGFAFAPAAATAPAPAVDEKMAAARDLVAALHMQEKLGASTPTIIASVRAATVAAFPQCAKDVDAIAPALHSWMAERIPKISEAGATIYASRFSAGEIREIQAYLMGAQSDALKAKFQKTPTGAKFFAQRDQIGQDMRGFITSWTRDSSTGLEQMMRTELRKRGHQI